MRRCSDPDGGDAFLPRLPGEVARSAGGGAERLHVRGCWPPPPGPRVAIVGARRPTPYGEAAAERLAYDLALAGVVIVSGLALGVDAAAHRGAIEAGRYTAAVLGTGVDVVYPVSNGDLANRILARGGGPPRAVPARAPPPPPRSPP